MCNCQRGKVPTGTTNPRIGPSVSSLASDRAAHDVKRDLASLRPMHVGPPSHPGTNQAEYGAHAQTSDATLRANIQAKRIVYSMDPLLAPRFEKNNLGVTITKPAHQVPIVSPASYWGQLPFLSQPQIARPTPKGGGPFGAI